MAVPDIDALFTQTLCGDYTDEAPWAAVRALRKIGTQEVFDRAAKWCHSSDLLARARGADVLAQLGKSPNHPAHNFPEESFSVINDLVQREKEPQVLVAALAALGHIGDPRAVPAIMKFALHTDPDVRYSVAFALSFFPDDPLSVETLMQMTQDADAEVRDWATFGLGALSHADSAEIREALVQRLNDSNENVLEEAMVGLASRKDHRVLSRLLASLEQPTMTDLVIEAACLMLGMEREREDWGADDYAAELRERFSS